MALFPDSYRVATAPAAIGAKLLNLPEFESVQAVRLAWLFSERVLRDRGTDCYAIIATPTLPSRFGPFFAFLVNQMAGTLDTPIDFFVLVDRVLWDAAEPMLRERIVFHELCHVRIQEDENGAPKYDAEGHPRFALRPHDVEIFTQETARYGVELCALDDLCVAIADNERRKRLAG